MLELEELLCRRRRWTSERKKGGERGKEEEVERKKGRERECFFSYSLFSNSFGQVALFFINMRAFCLERARGRRACREITSGRGPRKSKREGSTSTVEAATATSRRRRSLVDGAILSPHNFVSNPLSPTQTRLSLQSNPLSPFSSPSSVTVLSLYLSQQCVQRS